LGALVGAVVLAVPGWAHILNSSSSFSQSPFWSVECRSISVVQLKLIGVLLSCISVASLFGLYCLRGVEDNYFIKLELKIKTVSFICFSFFVFLIILPPVYNSIGRPMLIVFTLDPFYGVPSVTFISMGLIVILYEKKYKIESRSRASSLNITDSAMIHAHSTSEIPHHSKTSYVRILEMILENENAVQALESFLLKELSVENLLFVRAIQDLEKGNKTSEDLIDLGRKIHLKFVSEEADLEVNISSTCRTELESVFKAQSDVPEASTESMMHAFHLSRNEVILLIANDSLRRFCRTPEFKALGMSFLV
jgi:hypothetical protein